jgi:hypothetical protein
LKTETWKTIHISSCNLHQCCTPKYTVLISIHSNLQDIFFSYTFFLSTHCYPLLPIHLQQHYNYLIIEIWNFHLIPATTHLPVATHLPVVLLSLSLFIHHYKHWSSYPHLCITCIILFDSRPIQDIPLYLDKMKLVNLDLD